MSVGLLIVAKRVRGLAYRITGDRKVFLIVLYRCVCVSSDSLLISSWLDVARRKRSLPVYIQIHATRVGLLVIVTFLCFWTRYFFIRIHTACSSFLPFLSLSLSLFRWSGGKDIKDVSCIFRYRMCVFSLLLMVSFFCC